mmetsp:Transcript_105227/g.177830  ORF Transcript_105227/g.177830 Transcript_105227/m.177830 type:complete len:91 (-) Transcript_105227:4452-4724(-)
MVTNEEYHEHARTSRRHFKMESRVTSDQTTAGSSWGHYHPKSLTPPSKTKQPQHAHMPISDLHLASFISSLGHLLVLQGLAPACPNVKTL